MLYFIFRKFYAKKLFTKELVGIEEQGERELESSEKQDNEEALDKYAQESMRVQTLCQLAEMHIGNFDDEYEVNKFNERLDKATTMARNIPDEFYNAAALGLSSW